MAGSSEKQRAKGRQQVAGVLGPDEELLDVTSGRVEVKRLGSDTKRAGLLVVTTRRVFLYSKGLAGNQVRDLYYDALSSVDIERSAILGNIIDLAVHGDRTEITLVPREDVERVVNSIREQVTAHRSASSPTATVGDQVRDLARLRDEGLLTDEEFETKRRELLGL